MILADRPETSSAGTRGQKHAGFPAYGPTDPAQRERRHNVEQSCRVGVGRVSELALFSGSSVVGANEEGVELGPLRCYTKAPDSHKFLDSSKK